MIRYKYNVGDYLGPKNILFVERLTDVDSRGRHPWGLFQCPEEGCGKIFKTTIRNIVRGSTHRCPECSKRVKSERMVGNTFGKLNYKNNNLIGKKFGKWTVLEKTDKRQNSHVLWLCQCECGNFREIPTPNLTQNISTQCLICSQKQSKSIGEQQIEKSLKELNINFIPQKTFDGCKYKKLLRFDFYLPEYNTCIEYNGEQHYKNVKIFREDLEENQIRDNIKIEYCKNNNINLIIIPYWDKDKICRNYLSSLLKEEVMIEDA